MKQKCIIGKIRGISSVAEKFLSSRIKEEGLPVLINHVSLFHILPDNGEKVFFNDLAKEWCISKSSLSDIINKYQTLGYVEKCTCCEDKRAVYISITEKGIKIKDKLIGFEAEFLERILKGFEDKECEDFEKYIDKALCSALLI